GNMFADEVRAVLRQLHQMPDAVQTVLDRTEGVRELARELADSKSVLFLGRHVGFPVALEGALKLKELAYLHAEGFAAGELKHGPIALVEEGQPVFVIVPSPDSRDSLHAKVVSNAQEVRARGARTIVIAEDGDDAVLGSADLVVRVPRVPTLMAPLVTVVPLQVFAMEVASAKGLDVDQPATSPSPSPSSEPAGGRAGGRAVIVGVGIDVVGVERFGRTLDRTPALRTRLFTPAERDLPLESLAARFAAKEAVAKALGAPAGLGWHDAEVERSASGRPVLRGERHRGSRRRRARRHLLARLPHPTTPAWPPRWSSRRRWGRLRPRDHCARRRRRPARRGRGRPAPGLPPRRSGRSAHAAGRRRAGRGGGR
ncbi:MAG: holo-ACP synthase, partial [Quadrisphaera sp.]